MNIILIITYVAGVLFAFHQGSIFGESRGFEKAMDPYCDECGSCGEAGCCPPEQCKHFQNYLRDHKLDEEYNDEFKPNSVEGMRRLQLRAELEAGKALPFSYCLGTPTVKEMPEEDGGGFVAYYEDLGIGFLNGVAETSDEALDELHRMTPFVLQVVRERGMNKATKEHLQKAMGRKRWSDRVVDVTPPGCCVKVTQVVLNDEDRKDLSTGLKEFPRGEA